MNVIDDRLIKLNQIVVNNPLSTTKIRSLIYLFIYFFLQVAKHYVAEIS